MPWVCSCTVCVCPRPLVALPSMRYQIIGKLIRHKDGKFQWIQRHVSSTSRADGSIRWQLKSIWFNQKRLVDPFRMKFHSNWGKWANEWKIVHEPRGKVMELAWISVDQFPIGRQWEHVHRWLHSGHVWTCCLLFYYEIIFRLFLISFDRRARKMQPKDTPGALNDEKIDRPLGNFVDFLAGNYSNNLGNFF